MVEKSIGGNNVCVVPSPRRRYRINISLDEDTYNWVRQITEATGESSTPSGTVAGMVHLIRNIQRESERATPEQPNPYEDIGEMFARYTYAQVEGSTWKTLILASSSK